MPRRVDRIVVSAFLSLTACTSRPPGAECLPPGIDALEATGTSLTGHWRLVSSEGGYVPRVLIPAIEHRQFAMEFDADGGYREYENGVPVVRACFRVGSGRTFNTGDSLVTMLQLDTTTFFAIRPKREVALQRLANDTLVLAGTHSEALYSMFVRDAVPDQRTQR